MGGTTEDCSINRGGGVVWLDLSHSPHTTSQGTDKTKGRPTQYHSRPSLNFLPIKAKVRRVTYP